MLSFLSLVVATGFYIYLVTVPAMNHTDKDNHGIGNKNGQDENSGDNDKIQGFR